MPERPKYPRWARRKSKANPLGICNLCKKKIIDRTKNSKFDKECSDKVLKVKHSFAVTLKNQRIRYPNLDIKQSIKIKMR